MLCLASCAYCAPPSSLNGQRRGVRAVLPFLGPAFIAAVAYVDPGNFATNMAGGAQFGYMLLWVVLSANLMAMLIQSMSAKLGIATGRNLPEVCRDRFPRPVTIFLWIQAELIAMATDLAEFVGAALGLNLISIRCSRPPSSPGSPRSGFWPCRRLGSAAWRRRLRASSA
jgi:manganese transport protein